MLNLARQYSEVALQKSDNINENLKFIEYEAQLLLNYQTELTGDTDC